MAVAPRNPLLLAILPLLFSMITAAILLYCKIILSPGLDMGSAIILLIAGCVALFFGALAVTFIIRMLLVVSFSESITSIMLIALVLYAEVLFANHLQHRGDISPINTQNAPIDEANQPPLSARDQAYMSGIKWSHEQVGETRESCAEAAEPFGVNATEFVRGCVLEIPLVIPKLVAFDASNPDYATFEQSVTQKILPLLPEGITLITAKQQDKGYKIALRAATKLEKSFDLAVQNIKDTFTNFKRLDFKSDGNVMEYYFYVETKIIQPITPSKTSADEMERKIRGILPKDVTLSFAIPSGAGFMVSLASKPSIDVNRFVNQLEDAASLEKIVIKSITQINANEQELLLMVAEKR